MSTAAMSLHIIDVAAAALVFCAAVHDLAVRTVPNPIGLAIAALGVAAACLRQTLPLSSLAGMAVFALGTLVWHRGLLGGGDVKLLAALTLCLPPGSVLPMLTATALAGGLLACAYLAAPWLVPAPLPSRPRSLPARVVRAELWRLSRRGPLPYALAIACGACAVSWR